MSHQVHEPLVVVDYDPEWPREFERLAARVADVGVAVEHVGSTAVPGLAAKPIVDLYVLVHDRSDMAAAVARLEALGYRHLGDLGITGREAFDWPAGEQRHHLYLAAVDDPGFLRSCAFRDRLRAQPELVTAYAQLKRELAERHRDDRDAYSEGKSAFIDACTGDALVSNTNKS